MIARCSQVAKNQVSVDSRCRGILYTIIVVTIILCLKIILIGRFLEVISRQHIVCPQVLFRRGSINQQVRRLTIIRDIQQSAVIEQGLEEIVSIESHFILRIIMAAEVNCRHIRVSRFQVGIRDTLRS